MGSAHEQGASNIRADLLWKAGRELNSSLDPAKVYRSLLSLLTGSLPIHGLVVSYFVAEEQMIYPEFIWSSGKEIDVKVLPPIPLGPEGAGMQSQVIRSGEGKVFDVEERVKSGTSKLIQVGKEGKAREVTEEEPAQTRTAMMVPMKLEDRVVGVVQAMTDVANAYGPQELELLAQLVLLMTAAAQNAKLYQRAQAEIEDRKKAEAALKEVQQDLHTKQSLLESILETSPDIVYLFDVKDKKVVFTSGRSLELLGYSADEVRELGDEILAKIIHPDDLPHMYDNITNIAKADDGEVTGIEYRGRSKTGQWRWFLARRTIFERDPDGSVRLVLGFAADITERKEANLRVAENEERLRSFFNAFPQIAWSSLPDRTNEFINEWYFAYTGLPREAQPNEGWFSVVHPEDRQIAMETFHVRFNAGEPWEVEVRLRRYDGEYRWHLSRLIPVRSETGEIMRWLGTSTDIHMQKEAEAELELRVKERTAELQAALAELEGFTYSVSHDLRAPIRAIGSTSMMLKLDYGDQLTPEARELLDTQNAAAKKMALLVDELLRMARLAREELLKTDFDMSKLAAEVVEEIRSDGRAGTVGFSIEEGLRAHGDPKLLRLVLFNLLENAAKFSPSGGSVAFGRADGAFFVKDNGIGFDPQYTHKLFRPFERLVRDQEFPGTGIGLTNVQRIVQRHGGRVWAESQPGQGATFYFSL